MRTLFFLHIPKCAGMSLMQALLAHLPAGEVYQSTSMIRNWRENRPEFGDITNPARLRALIGHWLHEDMLPHLGGYLLFATSLRDPVARVRSQYRFDMGIRGGDFARQDREQFLRRNRNVMCGFLTRAFPTFAADFDDPVAASRAILSGMDCVFDISVADAFQHYLMAQVGIEGTDVPRANTSGHVTAELDATDAEIAGYCDKDVAVYRWFLDRAATGPDPDPDTGLDTGPGMDANPHNPVFDPAMRERFAALRRRPPDATVLARHLAERYAFELCHGDLPADRTRATLTLRRSFSGQLEDIYLQTARTPS